MNTPAGPAIINDHSSLLGVPVNKVQLLFPTLPIMIGALALIGWTLDSNILQQGIASSVAMNPATAVGFILLGLEALRWHSGSTDPWLDKAGQLAIALVVITSAMKLSDLVLGTAFGVDQLLFAGQLDNDLGHPNRMAPNTALCFFLLGWAMQLMRSRSKTAIPAAQALTLIPTLLALLALVGYLYGVKTLVGIGTYIPMAFNTAISFLWLTAAILFAHPHQGYLRVFTGGGPAGKIAAILLPASLLAPFLLGWISLTAQRAGYFDSAFDHALSVILDAAAFFTLSYLSIRTLFYSDLHRRKAEAELRGQQKFLAAMFENALDAVVVMDAQGIITHWSSQAEHTLGWQRRQAVGQKMHELIVPERYRAAHVRGLQRFLTTGTGPLVNTRIEIFAQHRDGHEFPIELSITPIKTADSYEFSAFLRDISERKRLEQQLAEREALFRAIFDQSPTGIELIDPASLRFVEGNPAACRMLGYTHEEFLGLRLTDTQVDMDEKVLVAMVRQVDASDGLTFVNRHRSKNGGILDVEIHARMLDLPGKRLLVGVWQDITERKRIEAALHELNRDFVTFLENTTDFIYFKDEHSRFRFCSQTLAVITGHAGWRDMIGKHDREVFPEETARIYYEEELPVFQDGIPLLNKIDPYFDAQGKRGWVSTSKWPVFDREGKRVIGIFGISRDISEMKLAEESLRITAGVFDNSQEGIVITDADNRFLDVNPAFTVITGYTREEVMGRDPRLLCSGRQDPAFYAAMWQSLLEKKAWRGEIWNRRKSGEIYAELLSISVICDDRGEVQRYVGVFSDISYLKAHEFELCQVANYDALTGIPNRRLLADRLSQAIARAQRYGRMLSVCYIDLDGFKQVNDQFGHEAGDQLLVDITHRLQQTLRVGDTLARLGGDEFVALFNELAGVQECHLMLDRILDIAALPMVAGGHEVRVSASMGVAFYPSDGEDGDTLLRHADQAMYIAKQTGKNRYHLYNPVHNPLLCTKASQDRNGCAASVLKQPTSAD
ncbi:MAG: PAS domain S-box protein [Methylococcaceae bacterium]|nr:MAG: PAS domain S-box protein [Methylococcaceae bacterium]